MRSSSSRSVTARTDGCVPSLWMSQRSKCCSGAAFITISGGWITGPAFISAPDSASPQPCRSEEHTSELQSRPHLVCRLLLEKKKKKKIEHKNAEKKKITEKRKT